MHIYVAFVGYATVHENTILWWVYADVRFSAKFVYVKYLSETIFLTFRYWVCQFVFCKLVLSNYGLGTDVVLKTNVRREEG